MKYNAFRMRKILLLGVLFFWWGVSAYFVPGGNVFPQNFQRTQKRIQIEALGSDEISVELNEYIKNTSTDSQTFQFVEPLPVQAENIHFYMNSAGGEFDILEGEIAREKLFLFAFDYQDPRYFRLNESDQTKIFLSRELTLEPDQEVHFKISFTTQPLKENDFYAFDLFLSDEIPSDTFELSLSLSPGYEVHHFLSSFLPQSLTDITPNRVTALLKKAHFTPDQDFHMLWSEKEKAVLEHWFGDYTYRAFFDLMPPLRDIQEVTLLLDKSGSMSGEKWERMKDWIPYLLEFLGEEMQVRIGFIDTDLEWYNKDFETNNFEYRKNFSPVLRSMKPVGKTDIAASMEQSQDGWTKQKENRATILLSDQAEFVPLEKIPSSLVLFHFLDDENNTADSLAKLSGGFSIKLFTNAFSLVEQEEFEKKWNNWRQATPHPTPLPQGGEGEILPSEFRSGITETTPFFVGRKYEPFRVSFSQTGKFLPRIWGQRRIAEILKNRDFSLTFIDALLAIGRTFGVQTRLFDQNTVRKELQSVLFSERDGKLLNQEILELESPNNIFPTFQNTFLGAIPLYKSSNEIWRQFDFDARINPDTLIEIAPFSEAQKELFVQFPEFTAEGFGIGKEVDFCTQFRCVAVREGKRIEPTPKDRAFFRDFDPNHWAAGYAIQAIDRGLLEPELNGKLHLDRAIDRGEFSDMVVKQLFADELEKVNGSTFRDLKPENSSHNAVEVLVQKGIVKGYPDGTFRPLQSLTRAEAVKILLASDGFSPQQPDPGVGGALTPGSESLVGAFPDSQGWEAPWVAEAVRRGMVRGYEDGTFRPSQDLTRAEAIKLVLKMR